MSKLTGTRRSVKRYERKEQLRKERANEEECERLLRTARKGLFVCVPLFLFTLGLWYLML